MRQGSEHSMGSPRTGLQILGLLHYSDPGPAKHRELYTLLSLSCTRTLQSKTFKSKPEAPNSLKPKHQSWGRQRPSGRSACLQRDRNIRALDALSLVWGIGFLGCCGARGIKLSEWALSVSQREFTLRTQTLKPQNP